MLVSFATIAGGVWIEVLEAMERTGRERCFRFDDAGNAEYALLADLQQNGERARWFSHVFKYRDFTLA